MCGRKTTLEWKSSYTTSTNYTPCLRLCIPLVGSSGRGRLTLYDDLNSVPTTSEMKLAGNSLNAPVAPPPGFTQPSQSNAVQAAQLIAAHQLSGAYGAGVQLPLLMQPPGQALLASGNHQFQKPGGLGQANYPVGRSEYPSCYLRHETQ